MKPTADELLAALRALLPYAETEAAWQAVERAQELIARAEAKQKLTVRARGKTFDNIADAIAHATGNQKFADAFQKK